MRISWTTFAALLLLAASISYSIAEEITISTTYPSPRGVYDAVRANIFRDLTDPDNRFVDPDGLSQLEDVEIFGSMTLGGVTITTWEEALPAGTVLMLNAAACPPGLTQLAGADLGRFPVIAAGTPLTSEGSSTTDPPSSTAGAAAGTTSLATGDHTHSFTPPFREFLFCKRD